MFILFQEKKKNISRRERIHVHSNNSVEEDNLILTHTECVKCWQKFPTLLASPGRPQKKKEKAQTYENHDSST